jgi:hypothetical protein
LRELMGQELCFVHVYESWLPASFAGLLNDSADRRRSTMAFCRDSWEAITKLEASDDIGRAFAKEVM